MAHNKTALILSVAQAAWSERERHDELHAKAWPLSASSWAAWPPAMQQDPDRPQKANQDPQALASAKQMRSCR